MLAVEWQGKGVGKGEKGGHNGCLGKHPAF